MLFNKLTSLVNRVRFGKLWNLDFDEGVILNLSDPVAQYIFESLQAQSNNDVPKFKNRIQTTFHKNQFSVGYAGNFLMKHQHSKCAQCNTAVDSIRLRRLADSPNINISLMCGDDQLTVEHILPTRWGGRDVDSNKTALCISCNRSNGSAPVTRTIGHIAETRVNWKLSKTRMASSNVQLPKDVFKYWESRDIFSVGTFIAESTLLFPEFEVSPVIPYIACHLSKQKQYEFNN